MRLDMFSDAIISEIKLEHLNTRCLIHISKFARALHRHNGTVIKLQDKNLMQEIVHHAKQNDNIELRTIFSLLMAEVKNLIVNSELERHLVQGPNGYTIEPKQQMFN